MKTLKKLEFKGGEVFPHPVGVPKRWLFFFSAFIFLLPVCAAGRNQVTNPKRPQTVSCRRAISDSMAIRAIIGEAGHQGERGMLAVACAIRNRGTLKGVYGVKAKHVDKEPAYVWTMARKAWADSAVKDITNGAQFWGSVHCDKNWIKNMERKGFIKTFEWKDHKFYKEKRGGK